MIATRPHHHFWWEVGFGLSQVGIALYHAASFAAQLAVSHTLWAGIVLVEIGVIYLLSHKDKKLALALLLERLVIFNPLLNLFRHKPVFYTSGTGSWLDRVVGRWYPLVFGLALAAWIWIECKRKPTT